MPTPLLSLAVLPTPAPSDSPVLGTDGRPAARTTPEHQPRRSGPADARAGEGLVTASPRGRPDPPRGRALWDLAQAAVGAAHASAPPVGGHRPPASSTSIGPGTGPGIAAAALVHDVNNVLTTVALGADALAATLREVLPADHPAYADLVALREAVDHGRELSVGWLAAARGARPDTTADLPAHGNSLAAGPIAGSTVGTAGGTVVGHVGHPGGPGADRVGAATDADAVDIAAALAAAHGQFARRLGHRAHIYLELGRGRRSTTAPLARVGATALARIMGNLVGNSADALPRVGGLPSGDVFVRLDRCHLGAAHAHAHGVVPPGPWLTIAVRDTGAGIPPDILPRCLQPYVSGKAAAGVSGTGLGLASVTALLAEVGGHLTIDTTVGVGTTVTVWLRPADGGRARARAG